MQSLIQMGDIRINLEQIAYTRFWEDPEDNIGSPVIEIFYGGQQPLVFRGERAKVINRILEQKSEVYTEED